MTTERQLIEAFEAALAYEPSADLWTRVLHSIEEDRRHRRRLLNTTLAVVAMIVVGIVVAVTAVSTDVTVGGTSRVRFDWRVMEGLEIGGLTVLVLAMGPGIRRFGRGYAGDLFWIQPETGTRMLRLLDVSYYLLFSGYILVTTRLSAPAAYRFGHPGEQLEEAAIRIGGLLLAMGLLHATTLMAMPLVAFVHNSTQAGKSLPRWVTIILVIAAVLVAQNLLGLPGLLGLLGGIG